MWPFPDKTATFANPPTKADLKPGNFQWPDFTSGWTKGITDKVNAWTGRSRPLTGAGATADVGTAGNRPFDTNVQAAPFAQKNYGGTDNHPSSMLAVNDWMAPHTEPVNNVLVDQTAHAPVAPDFNQKYAPNRVFR
jgi:hypothetical protein